MKAIFKYLFLILAVIMAACSTDSWTDGDYTVEVPDSCRLIEFEIPYTWNIAELRDIKLSLISVAESHKLDFDAKCRRADKNLKVYMFIGKADTIADGVHVLKTVLGSEQKHKHFIAEVRDGEIVAVTANNYYKDLDLEGSGEADDPYKIKNNSDFNKLLYALSEDNSHACGIYFKQTADINWIMMEMNKNRGLASETFGGCYDGGNYSINDVSYTGSNDSEKDVKIGLFKELSAGAEIKNLSVNMHISYAADCIGIIAGYAGGNANLENITITGAITQCGSNVGGLVGQSDGDVTIKNCQTNVSINANGENIGGAIGNAAALVKVDTFQTMKLKANFSVVGGSCVGGVIGKATGGKFTISGVRLNHSTDSENASVIGVQAESDCVGGIVGYVPTTQSSNSIKSSSVILSIKSDNGSNVGGFIGKLLSTQPFTISENCSYSGEVSGLSSVGGLIGDAVLSNYAPTFSDISIKPGSTSGDCHIKGTDCVGGLFGSYNSGKETSFSNVSVFANVTATGAKAGGLAGYITGTSIDISGATIGDDTMYVRASSKAGGIVGELNKSELSGSNSIGFSNQKTKSIPSQDKLKCNYSGHVRPVDDGAGSSYMGGAVGNSIDSSVKGICAKATVKGNGIYTGGLCGYLSMSSDLVVSDCASRSIVNGKDYTGGIVGEISGRGQIKDCINYGEVNGENNTGGIAGKIYYKIDEPYIYYCVNTGSVSGKNEVGGLAGLMSSDDKDVDEDSKCKIHNSANYGKVTSNSDDDGSGTGGILGNCPTLAGEILYCVNYGEVYAKNECSIGGIIGSMGKDAGVFLQHDFSMDVKECANYGKIWSSGDDSNVGGIVGWQEEGNGKVESGHTSLVRNCYNCGSLPSDHDSDTGGIVGYIDYGAVVDHCVNYGKISYGNATIGDHKAGYEYDYLYSLDGSGKHWPKGVEEFSQSEMGSQATYEDFDFGSVWMMSGGKALLRRCPFQGVNYTK